MTQPPDPRNLPAYPQPMHYPQPPPTPPSQRMPPGFILSGAVAQAVAAGWRVESQSQYQAVLVSGHRCNHLLHALLTLFLCGLWAPIWLILALSVREERQVITVDPSGQIYVAKSY